LWGLHQVAIEAANKDMSPIFQAALRSFGSLIPLVIWCRYQNISLFERDATLGSGLFIGVTFSSNFLLLYIGLSYTTAGHGAVALYSMPLYLALLAHYFLPNERLNWTRIIGLISAFLGVVLIFIDVGSGTNEASLTGDFLCVLSAICWALTTFIIKKTKLAGVRAEKTLFYQLSVSAVILLGLALAVGEEGLLNLTDILIYSLIFQIIGISFASYIVWFWMVKTYPAAELSSFVFLAPGFGVLFGALLLSETISVNLLSGMVLVGFGIILVNKPGAERE